jgi:enterochelin esterase-like enzyme
VQLVEDAACRDRLRSLRGVYIDCGNRDQFDLVYGARQLVAKLDAAAIPHHYEEFDDDHSAIDYRMDVSLPYLYRALQG